MEQSFPKKNRKKKRKKKEEGVEVFKTIQKQKSLLKKGFISE